MATVTPPAPSVTVMVAEELAAFAKRLTTLTIAPDERAEAFDLLRETCEALAYTANTVATDVFEETPAGATLGTPDGSMPAAGRLVLELSNVGSRLAEARDGFEDAAVAAGELSGEQGDRTPERVATITAGPGLRPGAVMYLITYTEGGRVAARSYARPDEIDEWRTDLAAAGWKVVDAEPPQEPDRPSAVYATPVAQVLLAAVRTRLAEQHGVTR